MKQITVIQQALLEALLRSGPETQLNRFLVERVVTLSGEPAATVTLVCVAVAAGQLEERGLLICRASTLPHLDDWSVTEAGQQALAAPPDPTSSEPLTVEGVAVIPSGCALAQLDDMSRQPRS